MKNKKIYIILLILLVLAVYGIWHIHRITGIFYGFIYSDIIRHYGQRFNVDPFLISAVMRKESGANPLAVSKKGAVGLMQVMPSTAKQIAVELQMKNYDDEMLKNPDINVMMGSYYLSKLLLRYDNDLILALGAYNAGIGNIELMRFINAGSDITIEDLPFKETRKYVKNVIFTYRVYKTLSQIKAFPSKILKSSAAQNPQTT
jgi:soluble lytic murein transglycosylase